MQAATRLSFRNVAAFAASACGKDSRLRYPESLQVGQAPSSRACQLYFARWKDFGRAVRNDAWTGSTSVGSLHAEGRKKCEDVCLGKEYSWGSRGGDPTAARACQAPTQHGISFSLHRQFQVSRQPTLGEIPLFLSFSSRSPTFSVGSLPSQLVFVRFKMVKTSSYHRRSRASPTGQSQKAHVGMRRLAAEYVTPGCLLVKQRRYIAWGFEHKRRLRHRKMYPGVNVGVTKNSSLVALSYGRVKYTHDVNRDILIVNVLPERREELLREDLWRYRTEHVASMEENLHVCALRAKETKVFPKALVNPPMKPPPRPKFLSRFDIWENPTLPDAPSICEDR